MSCASAAPGPQLQRPPARCPNPDCRVPLTKAYPVCPVCGEPLGSADLKARADAAAQRGLGVGPAWPEEGEGS